MGGYIFYDEAALINVYNADGSFEYGIQISTIQKGHGDIAVLDRKLYIHSRRPVIFVFQDDQMVETIDPYSSYEKYISTREIFSREKNVADGMCNYQLSESTNDIIRKDTEETVIDLPQRSDTAERLLVVGLLLLVASLYGYEKIYHKLKWILLQITVVFATGSFYIVAQIQ